MKGKLKIDGCIYPDKLGCRGCEHNILPELYDGGCDLLQQKEEREEAAANDRTGKRKTQRV